MSITKLWSKKWTTKTLTNFKPHVYVSQSCPKNIHVVVSWVLLFISTYYRWWVTIKKTDYNLHSFPDTTVL